MAIQSINSVNPSTSAAQTKSANKTAPDSTKQQAALGTDTDTLSISAAPSLQKALQASSTAPVVNENRVATIKAAIEAGTYQINPDRVADKMMHLEKAITNST